MNTHIGHPEPAPTLLLFADISGYTRYIRENAWTQAHALGNIAALLDAVVAALEPAFQLAKLEGDAAFCHADPSATAALPALLREAFAAFAEQQVKLVSCNTCGCLSCTSLDRLDLKIILHQGKVSQVPTRHGIELGGLDVILLHRLTKNRVQEARYVLWTESLAESLDALRPATRGRESCEGIGPVDVWVFTALPGNPPPPSPEFFARLRDHLVKTWRWLPLHLRRVPGKAGAFAPPPEAP